VDKKKIASVLNGIEYPVQLPNIIREELELNNFVAVYFHSDDLVYLKGAISDCLKITDGDYIYFKKNNINHGSDKNTIYKTFDVSILINKCEDNCCYYEELTKKACAKILCEDYELITDISHETFTVFEDGELYCLGIVFDINDIARELYNG